MNLQQAAQETERAVGLSIFLPDASSAATALSWRTIPRFRQRFLLAEAVCCSTNIFTAKPARAWAQAIKRAGPRWLFEISKALRGPEIETPPLTDRFRAPPRRSSVGIPSFQRCPAISASIPSPGFMAEASRTLTRPQAECDGRNSNQIRPIRFQNNIALHATRFHLGRMGSNTGDLWGDCGRDGSPLDEGTERVGRLDHR